MPHSQQPYRLFGGSFEIFQYVYSTFFFLLCLIGFNDSIITAQLQRQLFLHKKNAGIVSRSGWQSLHRLCLLRFASVFRVSSTAAPSKRLPAKNPRKLRATMTRNTAP